jgi:putative flippase GtrA
MNKSWTFRDGSRGRAAIARGVLFLGSYTVGFLLGSAVLWLVSQYVDPRLAKLASIGTSLVVNFILSKMVVFRST